ncbi:unnamed protein product [Caretta caretta]
MRGYSGTGNTSECRFHQPQLSENWIRLRSTTGPDPEVPIAGDAARILTGSEQPQLLVKVNSSRCSSIPFRRRLRSSPSDVYAVALNCKTLIQHSLRSS